MKKQIFSFNLKVVRGTKGLKEMPIEEVTIGIFGDEIHIKTGGETPSDQLHPEIIIDKDIARAILEKIIDKEVIE